MDVTSYILSKKYIEDTLSGAGALVGKSAYDIACENGFTGTPTEWLASLKGDAPKIGGNGNWFVNDVDTGITASPNLDGYATEDFVKQQIDSIDFSKIDLSFYVTREELSAALLGIVIPDVSSFASKKELEDAIKNLTAANLTLYATKEEVKKLINNIPSVDLSAYATKNYVEEIIGNLQIPDINLSDYATKQYVQDLIKDLGMVEGAINMIALTHEEILDICK